MYNVYNLVLLYKKTMSEAIKYFFEQYAKNIKSAEDLAEAKRALCSKYNITTFLNLEISRAYRELITHKKINPLPNLEKVLRKRSVRTMSGVAPVAVLTKPYPCPGSCAYCPREKDVPASYLSNEPAVMRAIRCSYDPYRQVIGRLRALEDNGHQPSKIEIIVIGGTWSYLPERYQYWYIANVFRAANEYAKRRRKLLGSYALGHSGVMGKEFKAPYKLSLSLAELKKALAHEQKINETSNYRLIGLTLETRPDYINEPELIRMREFGCTRVEIGVQAIDDQILKLNRRGHKVEAIAEATRMLRDYGFKITYHFMPALPGSNPQKDLEMYQDLFSDSRFQPDQIKFYPTVVTKGSLLYRWWKQGKYKPYSDEELQDLIMKCKAATPEYVRIIRLIRDIPGESIVAGNLITNLRQVMQARGVVCRCIRCREAKSQALKKDYQIKVTKYAAGNGEEYFISAVSRDDKILYGFLRLHLNVNSPIAAALVRELHVYGELVPVGDKKQVQHAGLGKKLLKEAERIAKKFKADKMAIISGIGARGYYRKTGYKLQQTYMVKGLK